MVFGCNVFIEDEKIKIMTIPCNGCNISLLHQLFSHFVINSNIALSPSLIW